MIRAAVLAAAALVSAAPAFAQGGSLASGELALNLSSVLGAEEFCGLSYDQAAIQAFIEERVPADDMGFASSLALMTSGADFQQSMMSGSAKTAHCAAITRTARHYGFIK